MKHIPPPDAIKYGEPATRMQPGGVWSIPATLTISVLRLDPA